MSPKASPITDLLCPRCRALLPIAEDKLPEYCPGCELPLRAKRQKALNHNFRLVWKKTFTQQGRAPRREFWGFAIIMGAIGLGLALLLDIVANGLLMQLVREYVYPVPQLPGLLVAILGSMLGAAMLLWLLALPLPLFNVTIRRLHDVGRSMFLPVLTALLAIPGILTPLVYYIWAQIPKLPALPHIPWVWFATAAVLCIIFALITLMFCVMDSERGTNKYGPSVKYPLE